ncbi:MAG: C1 family peptidase [Bacilli bacterium]|nr:C1 family peptidase [Bacilli bacterium]
MAKHVGALDLEAQKKIRDRYNADPKNAIIRRAISRSSIVDIAFEADALTSTNNVFNVEVKTMDVCNQKNSGRCWIFAGLNVLREIVAKELGLKKFELSQNYVSLFDKIEKANFALETILVLGERDHDDRELRHILSDPVSDGGQWDMFVNLVKKYGVVPQSVFHETWHSDHTRETNFLVNAAIRKFAADAAPLLREGKMNEARALKNEVMERIYDMFISAFGVPPTEFDFEYAVGDEVKVERGLTPQSFFEKYIGNVIDEYQSIINSPTADKPFMKNYTIEYLGNVVEGKPINHLNLPMERIEELIIAQLKAGDVVWFGSDVSFYRDRVGAAWDSKQTNYESLFGIEVAFEKDQMLDYWHSAMNHAMVIVGVHLDDNGKPIRWKIENSWGTDNGHAGYYVQSEEWFQKFVYQAVIKQKFLSEEEIEATKGEATKLHPWDPMGTLAD